MIFSPVSQRAQRNEETVIHSRGRATRAGATTMIRDVHLTRSNDQWPISRPDEEKLA